MKDQLVILVLWSLTLGTGFTVLASGSSTAPPPSGGLWGGANAQAFQYESAKARVVSMDKEKGVLVLLEEKKKNPKRIALVVGPKTSIKAGKEKITLSEIQVGTLVKVVFDRSFNAISIKVEKEKEQKA